MATPSSHKTLAQQISEYAELHGKNFSNPVKPYRKQIEDAYNAVTRDIDWDYFESGGTQATAISKVERIAPILYSRLVNSYKLADRRRITEENRSMGDKNDHERGVISPELQKKIDESATLRKTIKDEERIWIINLDASGTKVSDAFKTSTDKLQLQTIPRSMNVNPQSKIVGIASMGRNNPHYHYTGSEDTISFEITWYANTPDSEAKPDLREDVINNCRWLESLTKNNGYLNSLPRIMIWWGRDNLLFSKSIWVLTAAPYDLSQFQAAHRNGTSIIHTSLNPSLATQKLEFRRLTSHNLLTSEIRSGQENIT
jgi:hypothetical protein